MLREGFVNQLQNESRSLWHRVHGTSTRESSQSGLIDMNNVFFGSLCPSPPEIADFLTTQFDQKLSINTIIVSECDRQSTKIKLIQRLISISPNWFVVVPNQNAQKPTTWCPPIKRHWFWTRYAYYKSNFTLVKRQDPIFVAKYQNLNLSPEPTSYSHPIDTKR